MPSRRFPRTSRGCSRWRDSPPEKTGAESLGHARRGGRSEAADTGGSAILKSNFMSVSPGTRFGPYEIVSLLGAGGMGEVYRARDTRLGRDVALKVLPSTFAANPDRLARFEREARILASLSHPGIAHLYGFEAM